MPNIKYLYLIVFLGLIYAFIKIINSLKSLFKETNYLSKQLNKIDSDLENTKEKATTIKENFKGFFPIAGAILATIFIGSSLRKNNKSKNDLIKAAARQYAYNAIKNNKLL